MPTDITNRKQAYRTRNEGKFPHNLEINLTKEWDLKYGENPNQHAAIYSIAELNAQNTSIVSKLTDIRYVREDDKGKGGLSGTNTMDVSRGMDNLKYFDGKAVVIMKHNIVSGFAKEMEDTDTALQLFRKARDCDIQSNFGGALVLSTPLDMETAKAMYELKGQNAFFVDVVAAPGYEEGVIGYLQKQSINLKIAEYSNLDKLPKFIGDETYGLLSIKEMPGGRVCVQEIYLTGIKTVDDFIIDPMFVDKEGNKHIMENPPSKEELLDLQTAQYLNISGARSNGVVIVNDGTLVAMGSGQVERVGAVNQAIIKGMQKAMDREGISYDPLQGITSYKRLSANPFEGASCSSDAFFPFGDSIQSLARVGVTAITQPFGSIRDGEVLDAANKYKISMVASDFRCFGHF